MDILRAEEDFDAGINEGIIGLSVLGVDCPKKAGLFVLMSQLRRIRRLLNGRSPYELERLPKMENEHMEEAIKLLGTVAEAAWCNGDDNRCVACCLMKFEITLRHGLSLEGPHSLSLYGFVLAFLGRAKEAFQFGEVAAVLSERPGWEANFADTNNVVKSVLWHLCRPMSECLESYMLSYEKGMIHDPYHACFALRNAGIMGIFVGRTLAHHERYSCQVPLL